MPQGSKNLHSITDNNIKQKDNSNDNENDSSDEDYDDDNYQAASAYCDTTMDKNI